MDAHVHAQLFMLMDPWPVYAEFDGLTEHVVHEPALVPLQARR